MGVLTAVLGVFLIVYPLATATDHDRIARAGR